MTKERRAARMRVSQDWLRRVEEFRLSMHWSHEELGVHAAASVQRRRPFSRPTVGRYLSGALVTDELTQALSVLMDTPAPVPQHPRHIEWCELGQRLDAADGTMFDKELSDLRELVQIVERRKTRRS